MTIGIFFARRLKHLSTSRRLKNFSKADSAIPPAFAFPTEAGDLTAVADKLMKQFSDIGRRAWFAVSADQTKRARGFVWIDTV